MSIKEAVEIKDFQHTGKYSKEDIAKADETLYKLAQDYLKASEEFPAEKRITNDSGFTLMKNVGHNACLHSCRLSEVLPAEIIETDTEPHPFDIAGQGYLDGHNACLHSCRLALMKRLDIEKIENIIANYCSRPGFDEYTNCAQALKEYILGEEKKPYFEWICYKCGKRLPFTEKDCLCKSQEEEY